MLCSSYWVHPYGHAPAGYTLSVDSEGTGTSAICNSSLEISLWSCVSCIICAALATFQSGNCPMKHINMCRSDVPRMTKVPVLRQQGHASACWWCMRSLAAKLHGLTRNIERIIIYLHGVWVRQCASAWWIWGLSMGSHIRIRSGVCYWRLAFEAGDGVYTYTGQERSYVATQSYRTRGPGRVGREEICFSQNHLREDAHIWWWCSWHASKFKAPYCSAQNMLQSQWSPGVSSKGSKNPIYRVF